MTAQVAQSLKALHIDARHLAVRGSIPAVLCNKSVSSSTSRRASSNQIRRKEVSPGQIAVIYELFTASTSLRRALSLSGGHR